MSIIFWILITLGILFIIFYLPKISKIISKIAQRERKAQDEAGRQAKEQRIRPQKKLHEEEKKRWEDEYWRRHAKGER